MRRIHLLAAALVPIAGGCGGSPEVPPPYRSAVTPSHTPPSALSPASYVAESASIDLLVIRAGELALTHSSNPQVRSIAAQLVEGHRGTAAQLSMAGRRLDLLPSATLLPEHQAMLDDLSSSTDFDHAFVRVLREVHGEALSFDMAFAARGSSPTLRPVAANAASVERTHLALLRQLR